MEDLVWLFLLCNFALGNSLVLHSSSSRIVGGEVANAGEFPWAAAIYKTASDGSYFCGGSILSTDWVLTAGQCVDGAILFTIILGTNKLDGDQNAVRVATETYVLHPDYNPETLENDLGLIRFRQSVTFNLYMGEIHLPFLDDLGTYRVTAVGWGQTSDSESGLANDLNSVKLGALSNEECKIFYGDQIKDNMLCVSGQYNEGTCYGDIGGGLMWEYMAHIHVHVGIASFISSNGCESINPSGYTKTYPYNAWIRNVTQI